MKQPMVKAGDRVEIMRRDIDSLYHRKLPLFGFVTHIDGAYVSVRPTHCTWIVELLCNEIRKA